MDSPTFLNAASKGSHLLLQLNLVVSALRILARDNNMDDLGDQICSLALGSTGAAIGGSIGMLGGPVGMIIGGALGGIVGRILGAFGYGKLKEWVSTEREEEVVMPIDWMRLSED